MKNKSHEGKWLWREYGYSNTTSGLSACPTCGNKVWKIRPTGGNVGASYFLPLSEYKVRPMSIGKVKKKRRKSEKG